MDPANGGVLPGLARSRNHNKPKLMLVRSDGNSSLATAAPAATPATQSAMPKTLTPAKATAGTTTSRHTLEIQDDPLLS
jgi:hypothetical protein